MWRALVVIGLLGGTAAAQPGATEPQVDEQAARDYEKCTKARKDAMRDAEKLLDPHERSNAYMELPRCEEPPARALLGMRRGWEPNRDERGVLERGEFTSGRIAGVVAANLFVGGGIGQAFEGRWTKTGWVFWLGETISVGLITAGVARDLDNLGHAFDDFCFNLDGSACPPTQPHHYKSGKSLEIAGLIGLIVFRGASIVDVVYGAHEHNERLHQIRRRAGIVPTIAPGSGGATAGVAMQF